MSQGRIPIHIDIRAKITTEGDFKALIKDKENLSESQRGIPQQEERVSRGMGMTSMSARGLGWDLRMMSVGLMILKREFGGLNPVIDTGIRGLYVTSAALSTGLGAMRLYSRVTGILAKESAGAWASIKRLGTGVGGLTAGAKVFLVAAAAIVAIGFATWAYENITGISAMRREIRELKIEMEYLRLEAIDLMNVTAGLNTEMSYYRYILEDLKHEEELLGYQTDRNKVLMEATEGAASALGVTLAENTWRTQQNTQASGESARQIEKDQILIRQQYRATGESAARLGAPAVHPVGGEMPGPPGLPVRPEGLYLEPGFGLQPGEQLGGEVRQPGLAYIHRSEVIMQREAYQTLLNAIRQPQADIGEPAIMMAEPGGPGSIDQSIGVGNITVHVQVNARAEEGIEEAARRGGELAGLEVFQTVRSLEFERRRSRSRG